MEGAGGPGHLLAQQLIAAGERVLDVQPKLAARVRLLAAGTVNKNDPNDAGSVAVAALRSAACPQLRADDHAVLCDLIPGGVGKRAGTSRPGYGWRSRSATSQRPVSTGGRRGAVARSAMRSTPLGPEGTARSLRGTPGNTAADMHSLRPAAVVMGGGQRVDRRVRSANHGSATCNSW